MNDLSPAGPLANLRVIELAGIGPGPFAATLLADLGADVVRVERPGGTTSIMPADQDPMRRNRRSITLDLRTPDAVATLLELVRSADILIEGNRPGVTERLGIGPDDCFAVNPRLVYGRMTGWGQDGPLAARAGHDITYLALSGALHAMGREGERPAVPLNLLGDLGGGSMYLVFGVLAAVIEARSSGTGQVVDAAILDGALSFTMPLHGLLAAGVWRDERGVNLLDTGVPWYDVYEASDGKHVAIGAIEPQFYAELMTGLGLEANEADRRDPAAWPALRERIAGVIATRTRDEWAEAFVDTDACLAPVLSLIESRSNPQVVARRGFLDIGGMAQPAPAPRFSRTPPRDPRPPVPPGADTSQFLLGDGSWPEPR